MKTASLVLVLLFVLLCSAWAEETNSLVLTRKGGEKESLLIDTETLVDVFNEFGVKSVCYTGDTSQVLYILLHMIENERNILENATDSSGTVSLRYFNIGKKDVVSFKALVEDEHVGKTYVKAGIKRCAKKK